MPKSERRELRLTPEMAQAIDAAREDVSFNRWAERAFEAALAATAPVRASVVTVGCDADLPVEARVRRAERKITAPAFNRATSLKR